MVVDSTKFKKQPKYYYKLKKMFFNHKLTFESYFFQNNPIHCNQFIQLRFVFRKRKKHYRIIMNIDPYLYDENEEIELKKICECFGRELK